MVTASGTQIAVKCIILSIPYLYLLGSVMKCQNVTILHWLQHAQCICQMYMLLCLVIVSECISGAALVHCITNCVTLMIIRTRRGLTSWLIVSLYSLSKLTYFTLRILHFHENFMQILHLKFRHVALHKSVISRYIFIV